MMAWETEQVFQVLNRQILLFIFFATLSSYSFHSLVNIIYPATTFRHEWNLQNKKLLFFILFISGILVLVYSWRLREGWPFLALAAVPTFLYSAPNIPFRPFIFLRRIAIGKTIFLAIVWTYVTAAMPLLMSRVPFTPKQYYFMGSKLFLVYAICILFDVKDRSEDRKKGIRALPTILSEKAISIIYYLSLLFSLISTIMMFLSGMNNHVFSFMLIPIIICIFCYHLAITRKDDFFYYFILDGLMMLSALLQFIYLISITFVS